MLSLRFLGHATFLLNIDGCRLLTDPVLTPNVTFLIRHSPPIDPASLPKPHLILISHGHLDHYHPQSLKKLDPLTPCLVAPGLKPKLVKLGFTNVTELAVGQTFTFRRLKIKAVYARHVASFIPFIKPISACIGFIIEGSQKVYFPGDTDLYPEMAQFKRLHLDLFLVPIWGWALGDGGLHLNPIKAVQAMKLIKPRVVIPYHWGTFLPIAYKPFFSRFLQLPAELFTAYAHKYAPQINTVILPSGQEITLDSQ